MKRLILAVLLANVAFSAVALDKSELDLRIRKLQSKLEQLQSNSEKRIPAGSLRAAQGIILLDRTKAGVVFAYQGGSGVAIVRQPKSHRWGPPAFFSANEASLGFQVGGQQSFIVILLMNTNAVNMLADGHFKFGGEATGTAGNSSGSAEGTVNSNEPLLQVYTDREGLYGGATIKGDAITPDSDADAIYYNQYVDTRHILLDGKLAPGPAATELGQKIEELAKPK
jgi:lipid-binding SYLF domain-containing protein